MDRTRIAIVVALACGTFLPSALSQPATAQELPATCEGILTVQTRIAECTFRYSGDPLTFHVETAGVQFLCDSWSCIPRPFPVDVSVAVLTADGDRVAGCWFLAACGGTDSPGGLARGTTLRCRAGMFGIGAGTFGCASGTLVPRIPQPASFPAGAP
jgi:hypothetical protein